MELVEGWAIGRKCVPTQITCRPPSLALSKWLRKPTGRYIGRQSARDAASALHPSLAHRTARGSCLHAVLCSLRIAVTRYFMGVAPAAAAFSTIHTLSRFDIAVIHARTQSCHIPLNSIASSCGLSLSRYREIRGTEGERRNCLSSWWLTFFGPPAACNSLAGSTARTLMPTAPLSSVWERERGRGRVTGAVRICSLEIQGSRDSSARSVL